MSTRRTLAGVVCAAFVFATGARSAGTQPEDAARRDRLAWFHEAK